MGKDLKGKELGTGLYQRKDGRYEARALVKGTQIQLYDWDLKKLKKDFEQCKEEVRKGIDRKYENITLDEWFEEWFTRYKVPKIRKQSIKPMKTKYRTSFGKRIGHMKVSEIRNMDIQDVLNWMQQEGRAVSSQREALGRIRECLESAKHNKIISDNPCFEISVPWENTTKERRFLTQEEQNTFLKQVEDNWYKEMFYTMFLTGMRVGEIGALRWQDVDFNNKCIHIKHSLSCEYDEGIKRLELSEPKTHNSYRDIPFMGEVEEILLAQQFKQKRIKKSLGKRYRSIGEFSDLVFVTSMGSPVIRHVAEKEVRKIVNQINAKEAFDSVREQREPVVFEYMTPHSIRHTFCSRCFENDMNPKVVQKLMGHQHYSTTIEIYTHVTGQQIDEETAKFGYAFTA